MNSWSSPLGGSIKTATRLDTPLCTRSAASSAPAPPESSDKTMMSADATGSFTTSAHPAARRTGSRRERMATIANAANATTTRIGVHLGQLKIILGFIGSLNESAMSSADEHRPCSAKMAMPMLVRQRRDASRHPRRRHSGPRSSVALSAYTAGRDLISSGTLRDRNWPSVRSPEKVPFSTTIFPRSMTSEGQAARSRPSQGV
jgi:hypothetical protein